MLEPSWSFEPAIRALHRTVGDAIVRDESSTPVAASKTGGLGDFADVWQLFSRPVDIPTLTHKQDHVLSHSADSVDIEFGSYSKAVKWRDEVDNADLEDNIDPLPVNAASLKTRKRAARRARARERELKANLDVSVDNVFETTTDNESGDDLELLRRSPDRRALIAGLLGRPRPVDHSPPTSPSPPKRTKGLAGAPEKEWPVSNPFLYTSPLVTSSNSQKTVRSQDGLTALARKKELIARLATAYPDDRRYLSNSGLLEPAFTPLNTSPIGIHVFIDMSNISIGFHDCLKVKRNIPVTTRIRRVPMSFHNLSLVLERGRPAAKRILGGSDRTSAVEQAEKLGYETNILDRVHKAKTPSRKRVGPRTDGSGYASAPSYGETSGSDTNGLAPLTQYKWSEQAVDEILHLKMSHSILDSDKPSTMVLATGDAAEAEYSDGFLRMVERALMKGWEVELVSFKMNTSSLYRKKEFRQKWGPKFRWVVLDDFVEYLIED